MGTRRKSRELVLQMLFQADKGKQNGGPGAAHVWGNMRGPAPRCGLPRICFEWATDRLAEIES